MSSAAARQGIEVSFLVWTGDPGDQIVSAAEAEHVDMVLVGSHGRGAVGRLFLGQRLRARRPARAVPGPRGQAAGDGAALGNHMTVVGAAPVLTG